VDRKHGTVRAENESGDRCPDPVAFFHFQSFRIEDENGSRIAARDELGPVPGNRDSEPAERGGSLTHQGEGENAESGEKSGRDLFHFSGRVGTEDSKYRAGNVEKLRGMEQTKLVPIR
jgi:hypothetical protein